MTPRPVLSLAASNPDPTACDQDAGKGRSMSYEMFFRPQPVDLTGFARAFPDRARAYFRATGLSAAQIAVAYGVTERTAMNWLEGVTRPTGDKVAVIAVVDPEGFARHLAPDLRRAA